jgi:hypothetical protein
MARFEPFATILGKVWTGSSVLVALDVRFREGKSASEGLKWVITAGSGECRQTGRSYSLGTSAQPIPAL